MDQGWPSIPQTLSGFSHSFMILGNQKSELASRILIESCSGAVIIGVKSTQKTPISVDARKRGKFFFLMPRLTGVFFLSFFSNKRQKKLNALRNVLATIIGHF